MSEHETYISGEARQQAVRRASAALGRQVTDGEVDWSASIANHLFLKSGEVVSLHPGNVAYVGDGRWLRNGRLLDDAELGRI